VVHPPALVTKSPTVRVWFWDRWVDLWSLISIQASEVDFATGDLYIVLAFASFYKLSTGSSMQGVSHH
jgi:hypothetical protein